MATREVGRNEPCPCGSGKKHKACCGQADAAAPAASGSRWFGTLFLVAIAAGAVLVGMMIFRKSEKPETAPAPLPLATTGAPAPGAAPMGSQASPLGMQATPVTTQPMPMNPPGTMTPQPPGPAPAGKVWSPEHGHWHDAPGAMPTTPALSPGGTGAPSLTPVPPGGVQLPPGIAPAPSGGLTPQPPGPAPEGKVWSPEHGHWHDLPK